MSIFPNLHEESIYLKGARDVLMRLRDDYDMYLVPCAKIPCKQKKPLEGESDVHAEYCWFPIANKTQRRLIGDAMIRCLTRDRESLVKYLQGDHDGLVVMNVKKDRKGKVSEITIKIE